MDDALVEKVACAIYQEDTLAGLGKDVADRMRDRARAVLALPDLRLAGVKEGLEMAAKVAEDYAVEMFGKAERTESGRKSLDLECHGYAGNNLAASIRSLGPRP